MTRALFVALLLAVAVSMFAVPPGVAQESVAKLLILHDVRDDGYTYVGSPNQFAFLMLTAEGMTTVHKQGKIVVTQNGVKLYETLGGASGFDTAHDYDAFNGFSFAFPTAGPYRIHAEIPNPPLSADFEGYVHELKSTVNASVVIGRPTQITVGTPATFTVAVQDEEDKIIPHSDAIVEIRRADNLLMFRTHLHTHHEPMTFDFRFTEPGSYRLDAVGYNAYPEPGAPAFAPVMATMNVGATGPPMPPVPSPSPPPLTPPSPAPGKYRLFATYDPDKTVGMFGNIRLNAVVLDTETRTQASHVDFKATLTDPGGRALFESSTLHEYDGHLEVVTHNPTVGEYKLRVEASLGDWKDSTELAFRVVPPAGANGAGPIIVDHSPLGAAEAGKPFKIEFTMKTLAGTPHAHSEIDLQVQRGTSGVPLLQNKLHSHSDGKFVIEYVFPTAGPYRLVMDPETAHADATPAYYYKQFGGRPIATFEVKPGVALPSVPFAAPATAVPASGAASGAAWFLAAAAFAVAVAATRRQP